MEHSTDNHELSDRVLPPDYRASFIERSVAKGYPPEIFAGLRTEKEFGEAMGTFMKERYISLGYPKSLFVGLKRTTEITEKVEEYKNRRALTEKAEQYFEENLRHIKISADEKKAHAINEYHRKLPYKTLWEKTSVFLTIYSSIFISGVLMYIFAIFLDKLKPNDPDSFKIVLENLHQRTWIISLAVFSVCLLVYMMYRFNRITNSEYSAYREEYFYPKKQPSYQTPAVITPAPVMQVEKTSLQIKEERVIAKEKDVELDIRVIKADENLARAQRSVQLNELDDNINYAQKLGTYKNLVDKISKTPTALPKQERPKRLTQDEVDIKLDALLLEESQKISECISNGFDKEGEQVKAIESRYEKKRQDLLTGYI